MYLTSWLKRKSKTKLQKIMPCIFIHACCRVWLFETPQTSLPGSSVHGISQAWLLEWIAISSSRGIFPTQESNLHLLCVLAGRFFLFFFLGWLLYNIVAVFAIHCHESAMGLHAFPILNPRPVPSPSLQVDSLPWYHLGSLVYRNFKNGQKEY